MTEIVVVGLGVLVLAALGGTFWWRRRQQARLAGQALLQATEAGNMAEMQALLARHADLQARNAQGWTSLHIAAAGGDHDVVALLLKHGAPVNARCHVGTTPLDKALTHGARQSVLALLREHGAHADPPWDSSF
ncbi:MAG: ankyrin repeat domain-containing protein [Candidatus Tectimicrobiota bacterium]